MKTFRLYGPLGALLDEYERAIEELVIVMRLIPADEFTVIIDPLTTDPDCISYQSILNHVLRAGYGYIGYVSEIFNEEFERPDITLVSLDEVEHELRALFAASLDFVYSKTDVPLDDARWAKTIITRWKVMYNFEQVMEHAIVHVLRHRRQIEKFLQTRWVAEN